LAPASILIAILPSREQSFSILDVYNAFNGHRSSGTVGWNLFIQLCVFDPRYTVSFS